MINCDISEVTADIESEQTISRFVWNRYLKVLEFLSCKLNILCSILFHVKFVRLTTKYTLPAYTEYYVYYTIWMWKVEIAFWYIILSLKLKTSYFCQIDAVIHTRCHTVCKANHMSTCKLLIVQAHRNVWMYICLFLKPVQKTSHPEVWLLCLAILFKEREPRSRFLDKILCWWQF